MLSYRRKLTFIFTFLSFIFIQKNNAEGIFTNSKSKDLPFTYNLLYYKKNSNHLDLNLASEEFKKMPESNSLGFLNGSYWFQLTVNEAAEHKKIIAYIPTHHIRKIDIYKLTNLKLERISSSGNSLLQNQLLVDYKFPAFKISGISLYKPWSYVFFIIFKVFESRFAIFSIVMGPSIKSAVMF